MLKLSKLPGLPLVLAVVVATVSAGFLSLSPAAYGQGITTGTITGTVVDPSGALVQGAQIMAKGNFTGLQRQTTAGADGGFSFFAVPIGIYTLTITAPGFSAVTVNDVQVNAGSTTPLNQVKLSLGATVQVEVNGSQATLLETSDAQVTTTFDTQTVQNLPLNNGFDTITEVIPGVVSTHGDNFSNTNGDNFSVNGQSGRANNFELDGQTNNDNSVAGPQIFFGSQDAIQEIQVITNTYGAQYGRNAGAVVNYITKSGTNRFHGSAFELYQGDMLASLTNGEKNPLFDVCTPGQSTSTGCTPAVVPRYVENRYGGTLGGPIFKDKLFFFGSTFWDKVFTGVIPSASLPGLTPTPTGLTQLAAAFPGSSPVAGLATYGPYGVTQGNPQPIASTITTENITGPNGVVAPNVQVAGVTRSIGTPFSDQEELGRLDWQPTSKDHLFLRFFYQKDVNSGVSGGSIAAGDFVNVPATSYSVGADWTHAFSSHWIDQLRYSFQESKVFFDGGAAPNCLPTSFTDCPTFVDIENTSDLGFGINPDFPQGRTVKVTQIQNNATWTRGNQTILFGGEFDYQNSPNVFLPLYNGAFVYDDLSSYLQDSGILELASGNPIIPFTEPDAAAYLQDDWKVSPTFTAHLGIRWEFFGQAVNELHNETVARESNPATAFFDTSLPLSERTVGGVAQVYTNFEPRIGFAWNPDFDKKLVVRGGYAINANPAFYNIFLDDAITTPVAIAQTLSCAQNCAPAGGNYTGAGVRAANVASLALGGDPRFDDQEYVPSNFRTPYVQTYTLALEHQIGSYGVASIRYVGSKTTQNFQSVDYNPDLAPVAAAFPNYVNPSSLCSVTTDPGYGRPNCDRSNLAYVTNGGWASYNGLDLNLTVQHFHGLTGTLSYTYSRNIDNTTDVFASTTGAGSSVAFPQNPLDPDAGERGVDGNSFPQSVGGSFVYSIPRLGHSDDILSRIVNGFNLSGLYRFTSGQPYTAVQPLTLDSNTGDVSFCDGAFNSSSVGPAVDTCRLVLSNPKAPLNTVAYYNPYTGPFVDGAPTQGAPIYVNYNTDGFITNPTTGVTTGYNPGTPVNPASSHWIVNNQAYALAVGNPYPGVSRNTLRGQSFNDFDLTIYKTTKIFGPLSAQLSLAVYNVTNTMFRGTGLNNLADYSPTGYNPFLSNGEQNSGSVPGDTSGNRFVIIGAKLIF